MITPSIQITDQDVAGHYDELDSFYRKVWGEHVHHGLWRTGRETRERAVEQLTECVVDRLAIRRGDAVCDVGCGYGGTSRYLAWQRDAVVTGLTISPSQYEFAVGQNGGQDNPSYRLENWQTNSLEPSAFDGLVSIECLAHVEDKQVFFDQIQRVLRPGKRASITAWLSTERPGGWETRHLLEPICREGRLPGMGTRQDYLDLLENAGLRLVESDDLSQNVARTWSLCAKRVSWTALTSPAAWRYLLSRKRSHAVFLLTIARLMTAFRTGAMRYGLFVIEKPE